MLRWIKTRAESLARKASPPTWCLPFTKRVLGVEVTVAGIALTDGGIVAICVRGMHRQQIPILDLTLPAPPPPGSEWIAAYRHWVGGDE